MLPKLQGMSPEDGKGNPPPRSTRNRTVRRNILGQNARQTLAGGLTGRPSCEGLGVSPQPPRMAGEITANIFTAYSPVRNQRYNHQIFGALKAGELQPNLCRDFFFFK